ITLCVIGGNGGGEWQAEAAATTYTWEKDTEAPGSPTITIAGGDAYTATDDVALTLSATGTPTEMVISNNNDCSAGTGWVAYNTAHASWTLGQTNDTATV